MSANLFTTAATVQATCERGLAPYLAAELTARGFPPRREHKTGVEIAATLSDCARLCLQSRVAYSFLYQVLNFRANNADELYRAAAKYPWEDALLPDVEITLTSRVQNDSITDTRYPTLKLKDAIVDRLRQAHGRRPNSNGEKNGAVVHLNWQDDQAWIFINAAGQKLSDRGYRKIPGRAPVRETLAAAIVTATGYDGSQPLIIPMGGSGALAIEAALIARRAAPGLLRDNYGFKHLKNFSPDDYRQWRKDLAKAKTGGAVAPIILGDIDEEAVRAARQNAKTAGVDGLLKFYTGDFRETPYIGESGGEGGIIIVNPPYDERMGANAALYKSIGDWLKQKCKGNTAYVFTGNKELAKKIGLHAERRFEFFNAQIDCRLLKFSLY
ncbi:MAG: class I SAM-dependent RNA methyltransferase [Planctomycetota bacterium]|nr:class I SAM-dependent RNA methyltransferase [Planctomycetota bacterium]